MPQPLLHEVVEHWLEWEIAQCPPWRIDPTTHHTMSECSYHRATSRSLNVIGEFHCSSVLHGSCRTPTCALCICLTLLLFVFARRCCWAGQCWTSSTRVTTRSWASSSRWRCHRCCCPKLIMTKMQVTFLPFVMMMTVSGFELHYVDVCWWCSYSCWLHIL